jgi:hypothetical protein
MKHILTSLFIYLFQHLPDALHITPPPTKATIQATTVHSNEPNSTLKNQSSNPTHHLTPPYTSQNTEKTHPFTN